MKRAGLVLAVLASLAFGTSGAFVKPLFEAGWTPAAAVAARTLIAALVLTPFAVVALRGRWHTVWSGRWQILGIALVGIAATQLAYFSAVERIAVGTAILIEYLAPVLLVVFAWATTRRIPRPVVIVGSIAAVSGLILVVGPGSLGSIDALGVLFAFLAAIGCAAYYLIAARPSDGLPAVALAWAGMLLGSVSIWLVAATGLLPLEMTFGDVLLFQAFVPWWGPLLVVGIVGTALGYALSITATGMLGSRLMSFVALLEVVFATMFAWLTLGEQFTLVQLLGGLLILAGIALVNSDRERVEPGPLDPVVTRIPAPSTPA